MKTKRMENPIERKNDGARSNEKRKQEYAGISFENSYINYTIHIEQTYHTGYINDKMSLCYYPCTIRSDWHVGLSLNASKSLIYSMVFVFIAGLLPSCTLSEKNSAPLN